MFTITPGFSRARYFLFKQAITVYFDKEYNLEKVIEHDIKINKLTTPRFTIANSQQDRLKVADRSIRITNISLDTTV